MTDSAVLVIRAAAALAVGFVVPGYLAATLLKAPLRWATAFLLSLVLLFQVVSWTSAAGLPVRPGVVWTIELLLSVALAFSLVLRNRRRPSAPGGQEALRPGADGGAVARSRDTGVEQRLLVGAALAIGVAILLRSTLWPLSGFDTPFRWDFLATRILERRSLDFYPPVSADDFRTYFFPDGIPPLVSFAYWWVYGSVGAHAPGLTGALVAAQFAVTLVFTGATAGLLHSRRAGALAVGVLASSPLFCRSVSIGQETGLTALSMAAMVYFLIHARAEDRWRWPVLAGVAAALGALSREYGWMNVVVGATALLWGRRRWRPLAVFCAAAAVLAGPWYLRNWARTGNPLYSIPFGAFPVNPVHAGILASYREMLSVGNWDAGARRDAVLLLLQQAALPFVFGLAAAGTFLRAWGFLGIGVVVTIALWLQSIGFTSGGAPVAVRMLSPALVLLSILAGVFLAKWAVTRVARGLLGVVLFASCCWGLVSALLQPLPVSGENWSRWKDVVLARRPPDAGWWTRLPEVLPAGSRVLTDNAYVHAGLAGTAVEAVAVWSPEVGFLLDDSLAPEVLRRRLRDLGIRYVILEDNVNLPYLTRNLRLYRENGPSWPVIAAVQDRVRVCVVPP